MAWTREQMAARAAKELRDGFYVNLGIGLPTLGANYILTADRVAAVRERPARDRSFPTENEVDADLINAGKQTVTTQPARASSPRRQLRHDPRRPHQPRHPRRHAVSETGDLPTG